jgi:hypothetical protein
MTWSRWALSERDLSEPDIVEAAEGAGWEVFKRLPVDLLCAKAVTLDQLQRVLKRTSDGRFIVFVPLECKTPQKNGKRVARKDQKKQDEFCGKWKVDRATTKLEARLMLGEKAELGG